MIETSDDNKLRTALNRFVMDAISRLRKTTDISKIPLTTHFELREVRGRKRIIKSEAPNWWQVNSYMNPVSRISTCKDAVEACLEHQLLKSRHMQAAHGPNASISFSLHRVPNEFLAECIARQNGLRYGQRTFESVFADLMSFLKTGAKNSMCLIAPLDMVQLHNTQIRLGPDARVRRLSPYQIVDLVNHCPTLSYFYGHGLHPWFNTILEFDYTFEWKWFDELAEGPVSATKLKHTQDSRRPVLILRNRLNQEILLLGSLLNKRVCPPTYVIDYRGWNSVISSGGTVPFLPWIRSSNLLTIDKSESKQFTKFREKLLSIQDEKIKRRIFAAMRNLSSSQERYYSGDRLQDAVAGLEGLLVNAHTGLRHQFAEHIALLLERELSRRAELFKAMCAAYDLRSKVAHGDVVADDKDAIMGAARPLIPTCHQDETMIWPFPQGGMLHGKKARFFRRGDGCGPRSGEKDEGRR